MGPEPVSTRMALHSRESLAVHEASIGAMICTACAISGRLLNASDFAATRVVAFVAKPLADERASRTNVNK